MHVRAETSHEPKAAWPEDIFAVLQRYDVRQVHAWLPVRATS